jgi:hypothetical protein
MGKVLGQGELTFLGMSDTLLLLCSVWGTSLGWRRSLASTEVRVEKPAQNWSVQIIWCCPAGIDKDV